VEAATLGALFLLAAIGPAFVAGATDMANTTETDRWVFVIGIIGAVGVGAMLQLTGRALWEFLLPLSPQGGWRGIATLGRWIRDGLLGQLEHVRPRWLDTKDQEWMHKHRSTRRRDFRAEIARSADLGLDWNLTKPVEGAWLDKAIYPEPLPEAEWSYGHRAVITAEYYLYSEAKDGVLQWIRRRYQRFVDAVSAASAILLGILFGLSHPGQDLLLMWLLNGALLLVAAGTFAFANENRRAAQQMETFWYQVRNAHPKAPAELNVRTLNP
jgi:hypothetical protein